MSDMAFWQRLLPHESISERPFHSAESDHRFSDTQADRLSRQIRKEGYFQSEPVIPAQEYEPLAQAITRINQARMLPVFVAVYDRFWQFLHSLRNTFKPMLGESYRLSPDFWAWHVAPNSTGRGWAFHRDAEIGGPFDANAHIH
jgi:hypothetical protein